MSRLLECVPNISEGRDMKIVEGALESVRAVPGVALLDHSSDASHNRSVLTFLGDPERVADAAVALARYAAAHIDLTKHSGAHPRMGAVDVIPFIPIRGVSQDEAKALAKEAAKRIWEEAGIPVFLYADSATAPHRADLAAIRRGEFEGMPEKLLSDDWTPDFGARQVHPTAGVVALGVRSPLIAFNINLSTPDVSIAKKIAKTIRQSNHGLDYVKAIGVFLEEKNCAQVSINMANYAVTPLYRAVELVRAEAARWGAGIVGTEIIGLTPAAALIDSAMYYLQLNEFDAARQVLEWRIGE